LIIKCTKHDGVIEGCIQWHYFNNKCLYICLMMTVFVYVVVPHRYMNMRKTPKFAKYNWIYRELLSNDKHDGLSKYFLSNNKKIRIHLKIENICPNGAHSKWYTDNLEFVCSQK